MVVPVESVSLIQLLPLYLSTCPDVGVVITTSLNESITELLVNTVLPAILKVLVDGL